MFWDAATRGRLRDNFYGIGVRLAWLIHCQPLAPFFQTLKRGAGFVGNRSRSIVSCAEIKYETTMLSPFTVDLRSLNAVLPTFRFLINAISPARSRTPSG